MAAVRLTCPECRATLRLAEEPAGKQVKCPKCGGIFTWDASNIQTLVEAEPSAEDEDNRPRSGGRRSKQKSSAGMLVAIPIVVIVLAVFVFVAVAVVMQMEASKRTDRTGGEQAGPPD